jgi:glycosyltransferase involved in cell wall biosynthesis
VSIVHLSTDFPDSFAPDKTHAIKNLIDATRTDFDHIVYSLNRVPCGIGAAVARAWKSREVAIGSYGPVWTYDAPGKGLFLRQSLEALADNIANDLARRNVRASLIVGHKLTMEGIIARRIAELLRVPFAISIQGNTDRNIINIRRDLHPLYRRIFHGAAAVFPFTPWALNACEAVLGRCEAPVYMLPCITSQETVIAPQMAKSGLMTAFHLRHREIKNLPRMLDAASVAAKTNPTIHLDIYGTGSPADIAAATHDIAKRAAAMASLKGGLPHDQMQRVMNGYAGYTMISKRESYGLVFIEALLAGCPVAYPKNAAIDGYFDGHDFAGG